jgi:serine/threonine protein kinase
VEAARFGDVEVCEIHQISQNKNIKIATKELVDAVKAVVRGVAGDATAIIEFMGDHTLDLGWGSKNTGRNVVKQKFDESSQKLVMLELRRNEEKVSANGLFCCCKESKLTVEGRLILVQARNESASGQLQKLANVHAGQAIKQIRGEDFFGSHPDTREEASAEQKALAAEILVLLDSTQNQQLLTGREHIKAGNLDEALTSFDSVVNASGDVLPENLAKAKTLRMYTLFALGIEHLEDHQYDQAAQQFSQALKHRVRTTAKDRVRKLRLFYACALYEAGKQHRENGDWTEAKARFDDAKKSKDLPAELVAKVDRYLEEFDQKLTGNTGLLGLTESAAMGLFGESKGAASYKNGKRELREGHLNLALQLFQEANEDPVLRLSGRVEKCIAVIKHWKQSSNATECVFSNNCTHVLGGSSKVTANLGFSEATLGLSSKILPAIGTPSRNLVMVLNKTYPENSAKRASLIVALKSDVRKALCMLEEDGKATTAEFDILDITHGSVIAHFRFLSNSTGEAALLEEEYLRQVQDKESKLYQGEVACHIDQKRTLTMTEQLGPRIAAHAPSYHVGDTITLAHIHGDTIECKVESLLGQGSTANVFKVTTSGKVCALKVLKAESSFGELCEEASLLLTCSHPHIHPNVLCADFVWYEQSKSEMFFLLELADGGDLETWMDDERLYAGTDKQQQDRLLNLADQFAAGLQHLHLRSILHQDFKPPNVLMTKHGKPLLADLGTAAKGAMKDGRVRAVLRGCTPTYASPHVRQLFFQIKALPVTKRKDNHPVTHRDDFFALGATIFDMFANCGWRRGLSVAEVVANCGSVTQLVEGTEMRVAVTGGVLEVLQACFGTDESLTVNSIVELTRKLSTRSRPQVKGMMAHRSVSSRNNLSLALFDSGVPKQEQGHQVEAKHYFEAAHNQLELANDSNDSDARTLNNLAVVKLKLGDTNEAAECLFKRALQVEPNHKESTFNTALLNGDCVENAEPLLDRTGASGVATDPCGKVELVNAVRFAPAQKLEVYRRGHWEEVTASELENENERLQENENERQALVLLTFRTATVRQTLPACFGDDDELAMSQARAPALFANLAAMKDAKQAYDIHLKEEHTFIYGMHSMLNTRCAGGQFRAELCVMREY